MGDRLPLTDLTFNLLVALKDEELHGYALVQRLRRLQGRETLRTGTVYAALARLDEEGLVEEVKGRPRPDEDERRQYYRLTARGIDAARAEAARLATALERARGKDLLPDAARG